MRRVILGVLACVSLVGCGPTKLVYEPSSPKQAFSGLTVTLLVSENSGARHDMVGTTPTQYVYGVNVGSKPIYPAQPLREYVENALATEFRLRGVEVANGHRVVAVEVRNLFSSPTQTFMQYYEADAKLTFRVAGRSGAFRFDRDYEGKTEKEDVPDRNSLVKGPQADVGRLIALALRRAIEAAFADPEFIKAISEP